MSDADRAVETATLLWEGRTIELEYESDWLGHEGVDHLTVRCGEPLPITETGYRSAFFDDSHDPRPGTSFVSYVEAWLKVAARSEAWRKHVNETRQLSLF